MGNLTIKEINRKKWGKLWNLIEKNTLQQSWEYGESRIESSKWNCKRFLIEDNNKKPIALAQIIYFNLGPFGGIARLNRGPLFIEKSYYLDQVHACNVIETLFLEIKKRRWWLLFFAPNFYKNNDLKIMLKKIGLNFRKKHAWSSLRLCLKKTEKELFLGLKGKWRNMLRKALKSNISIESWNYQKNTLEELISFYETIKKEKDFSGLSSNLIRSLSSKNSDIWKFNLYKAIIKDENSDNLLNIGMLVTIIHGDTGTYTIGVTNSIGRKYNANYLLLWHSILESKKYGCKWFDLGGLNKSTPKGISHFKKGTNAIPYELIGETYFISIL